MVDELCGVILVAVVCDEAEDPGRGEGRDLLDPWLLASIFRGCSLDSFPGEGGRDPSLYVFFSVGGSVL